MPNNIKKQDNILLLELKSFNKVSLIFTLSYLKLICNGSYFIFPSKYSKISLLRSPHVNKKSFEQFEKVIYKATIKLKCSKRFLFSCLNLIPKEVFFSLIKIN